MADRQWPEYKMRAIGQWPEARVSGARERVLAEAFVLFYMRGIRAVGINLVIAESGVAKASFYRHFPSKDDLIVAYVYRRHHAWLTWLSENVAARTAVPAERLLAIFDTLGDLFDDPLFRGCPVINAVAEVGHDSTAVLDSARTCQANVGRYVADLAAAAGLSQPDDIAQQWQLLIDGAHVAARLTRDRGPAVAARRAAELVLLNDSRGSQGTQAF